MSEENKTISVMGIVTLIDGKKKIASCMLSLKDCNKDKPCPLHQTISQSKSEMIKSLESTTISELAENLKTKKAFLPLD